MPEPRLRVDTTLGEQFRVERERERENAYTMFRCTNFSLAVNVNSWLNERTHIWCFAFGYMFLSLPRRMFVCVCVVEQTESSQYTRTSRTEEIQQTSATCHAASRIEEVERERERERENERVELSSPSCCRQRVVHVVGHIITTWMCTSHVHAGASM